MHAMLSCQAIVAAAVSVVISAEIMKLQMGMSGRCLV
jgi:hypothetical protein